MRAVIYLQLSERVQRSYGVVTSSQVMAYLTDHRKVDSPMARSEAHDLMGELATLAWEKKMPFFDVVSASQEVKRRISIETLKEITDPLKYIGESKRLIELVAGKYHKVKTL